MTFPTTYDAALKRAGTTTGWSRWRIMARACRIVDRGRRGKARPVRASRPGDAALSVVQRGPRAGTLRFCALPGQR